MVYLLKCLWYFTCGLIHILINCIGKKFSHIIHFSSFMSYISTQCEKGFRRRAWVLAEGTGLKSRQCFATYGELTCWLHSLGFIWRTWPFSTKPVSYLKSEFSALDKCIKVVDNVHWKCNLTLATLMWKVWRRFLLLGTYGEWGNEDFGLFQHCGFPELVKANKISTYHVKWWSPLYTM
jgi:hypothetical protein